MATVTVRRTPKIRTIKKLINAKHKLKTEKGAENSTPFLYLFPLFKVYEIRVKINIWKITR